LSCLRQTFEDLDLAFVGGETSREAMDRGVQCVSEVLSQNYERVAIVTHGNLMTLLLKHFDGRFGFEERSRLTNPDVFVVTISEDKSSVERIWS
ncbi:histidine phosphatase family protein, partial [Alicyclobacillus shizuokensis]|uniref:histidine phosphatase family protein n=1 Tax=Alicyclobacillus shizuokensis TaxID=392014 RepID=UPI0009FA5E0E